MIISFSVFKEKILDGSKKQTIRLYNEFRYKQFKNAKKYQLYWGNPRNGGTLLKEVEPLTEPLLFNFKVPGLEENKKNQKVQIWFDSTDTALKYIEQTQGCGIDNWAKADGFENHIEMHNWFYAKYGEKMFEKKFMLLRWK